MYQKGGISFLNKVPAPVIAQVIAPAPVIAPVIGPRVSSSFAFGAPAQVIAPAPPAYMAPTMPPNFSTDYGDGTCLMSFLCAVYSRLAYINSRDFLNAYTQIFDDKGINNISGIDLTKQSSPISITNILNSVNTTVMSKEGINGLIDDTKFLNTGLEPINSNSKNLKFTPMSYRVNLIIGDERKSEDSGSVFKKIPGNPNCEINDGMNPSPNPNLVFINITDSNYGEIYVIGDKRMPNVVIVSFRGTATAKSAGSYMRVPLNPQTIFNFGGKNIQVLLGVHKILNEIVNTIFGAIEYVSKQLNPDYLKTSNSIKIITTGHSLGGALATLFAFKYVFEPTYTTQRTWLDKNIGCFSLGSPRVFGKDAAALFCCLVQQNQAIVAQDPILKLWTPDINKRGVTGRITYLRMTTYNDPVPGMPKGLGWTHPCSDLTNVMVRANISQDCLVQVKNPFSTRCLLVKKAVNTNDYTLPLKCSKTKRAFSLTAKTGPAFVNRVVYHMQYLGVSFAGGADLTKVLTTSLIVRANITDATNQIKNGDTVVRLVVYPTNKNDTSNVNILFFDLVPLRDIFVDDASIEKKELTEKISMDLTEDTTTPALPAAPAPSSTTPLNKNPEDTKVTFDFIQTLINQQFSNATRPFNLNSEIFNYDIINKKTIIPETNQAQAQPNQAPPAYTPAPPAPAPPAPAPPAPAPPAPAPPAPAPPAPAPPAPARPAYTPAPPAYTPAQKTLLTASDIFENRGGKVRKIKKSRKLKKVKSKKTIRKSTRKSIRKSTRKV
jgi:hypothetical protein